MPLSARTWCGDVQGAGGIRASMRSIMSSRLCRDLDVAGAQSGPFETPGMVTVRASAMA